MSSVDRSIYALHGFLGRAQDWTETFHGLQAQIHIPNYFFDEAFTNFSLDSFIADIKKQPARKHRTFVGYSLGGRIGLHILEKEPQLFDHYVFISTHPGLKNTAEKQLRIESDQKWIEKIQSQPWSDFLVQWNQQDVLANSQAAPLKESDFKKDLLITALSKFSLGHQKDYSELIQQYQKQITWIVGTKDQKFLGLAEDLKQKKILLDYKRISSGHRILLDNPKDLQAQLELQFQQQPE